MPWQECNLIDERLKFIAGLLDGEKMAVLCRRFGVSRKTGYKILDRYNSCGLEGLTDRSRRPYRHANQLPVQIETLIVRSKQERPHWGAPKIRKRLARLYPDIHTPAISTVHAVLDRHGLVKRRGRRRHKATGTPLSTSDQPNDLWGGDAADRGRRRARLGANVPMLEGSRSSAVQRRLGPFICSKTHSTMQPWPTLTNHANTIRRMAQRREGSTTRTRAPVRSTPVLSVLRRQLTRSARHLTYSASAELRSMQRSNEATSSASSSARRHCFTLPTLPRSWHGSGA
jgi:hypothetical protein